MIPRTKLPLYRVLKLQLEEKIVSGELASGELLPTEFQLCQQYQVSRITVRKALDQLVKEGLITRRHGRGTFVRRLEHIHSSTELSGYSASMRYHGQAPRSTVLKADLIPGDANLLKYFGLPADSRQEFWHFLRLRYVKDLPSVVANHYVLKEFGDLMRTHPLDNVSFFGLYERLYGQPIHSSDAVLSAVSASEENARLLQLEPGSALLWYRSVNYFADGTAAELDISYFRPDHYVFEYHLVRDEGKAVLSAHSDITSFINKNLI